MSLPHQIAAYDDCVKLYETAAADPKGARACLITYGAAFRMRARMNMARYLLRQEAVRMYEPEDPRYNKSEFDYLKVTVKEDEAGEWWVYVEPHGMEMAIIESLSEI